MKGLYAALLASCLGLSACQVMQPLYDNAMSPVTKLNMNVAHGKANGLVGRVAWFSSQVCPYVQLFTTPPLTKKQRQEASTFQTEGYEKVLFEYVYVVTQQFQPWMIYKIQMVNTGKEAYLTTPAEPGSVYMLTDRKKNLNDCFLTIQPGVIPAWPPVQAEKPVSSIPSTTSQSEDLATLKRKVDELNKKTKVQEDRINELMMAKEYDAKIKTYHPVTSSTTVKAPATQAPKTTQQGYSLNRYTPPKKLIPDVQYNYGGSCPCSGYSNCFGPRGGRYCITSGGNKRYR